MRQLAAQIVKTLTNAGYLTYFAGGWVRDYLMDISSSDIDIATTATPEEVIALFPKTVHVGISFGVVIVILEGHKFEVATFRKEGAYLDGRRPDQVTYSTPEEDALRRDFTINGLFFDPIHEIVYDFVGGVEDIKAKIIRAIGIPRERFFEDRLRMIRAIRFSARFGFPIEKATEAAILEQAQTLFPPVAKERVWQELKKMSSHASFPKAIVDLHRLGLLPVIFPHLEHIPLSEIKTRAAILSNLPEGAPLVLQLLEIFGENEPEFLLQIFEELKASSQEKMLALFGITADQLFKRQKRNEPVSDYEWAKFFAHPFHNYALEIAYRKWGAYLPIIKTFEDKKRLLEPHIGRLIQGKTLVTSHHLIERGIAPGKKMGELIRQGEELAVNQNIVDPHNVIDQLLNGGS